MTLYDGNGNAIKTQKTLTDKKILVMGDSISTDAYGNYAKWVTDLINDGFFDGDKVTNNSYHATGFVEWSHSVESTTISAALISIRSKRQ